jgi:predicted O-linked N-acetylglucosamine transferase (SPINDLY family)
MLDAIYQKAVAEHVQGRLETAVALYEQVLAVDPSHVGALSNLGNARRRQGRTQVALGLYQKALAIDPVNAEVRYNHANACRDLGRIDDAIAGYRAALAIRPDLVQARFNLGQTLADTGDLDDAEAQFRQTILHAPRLANAHTNLGTVLRHKGQLNDAAGCHLRALELQPDFAEAAYNLANVRLDQGLWPEAVELYRRACTLRPERPAWWHQLGMTLWRTGHWDDAVAALQRGPATPTLKQALKRLRLPPDVAEATRSLALASRLDDEKRYAEAVTAYRHALDTNPLLTDAYTGLGVALYQTGQYVLAEAAFRAALEISPDSALAHTHLGHLLVQMARFPDAENHLRLAVALQPRLVTALVNLSHFQDRQHQLAAARKTAARALILQPNHPLALLIQGGVTMKQGRHDEAEACFRQVQQLMPDHPGGWSSFLLSICYSDRHDPKWVAEQHRLWGERVAQGVSRRSLAPATNPEKRLRVGYLSGDFCRHPVGYFITPILRHHDPAQFDVVCYHSNPRTDDLTVEIRRISPRWKEVASLDDDQLAAMIESDGVDILVDLSGHTDQSRLTVLARRAAPVQVSYVGYPFTTGLREVDYLLADAVACPPECDDLYVETIYRLPCPFWSFRPHPELPAVGSLPATQNGYMTFGSFNHVPKLSAATVSLWSQVLRAVPASRLVLQAGPFSDAQTVELYRDRFASHGIAGDRLELRGPSSLPEYLAAYNRIDVALDPLPFNGGTTTCEALLMGVPVLTLPGRPLFGRMGASIMTAINLTEFIATDGGDYVNRAAYWASHREQLAQLRAGLRARFLACGLGDGAAKTRDVEAAYRAMWRKACS